MKKTILIAMCLLLVACSHPKDDFCKIQLDNPYGFHEASTVNQTMCCYHDSPLNYCETFESDNSEQCGSGSFAANDCCESCKDIGYDYVKYLKGNSNMHPKCICTYGSNSFDLYDN